MQRLYAVFFGGADGRRQWAMFRNGKEARQCARFLRGELASMPLPGSAGPWDAPTFRCCADRYEDFREQ